MELAIVKEIALTATRAFLKLASAKNWHSMTHALVPVAENSHAGI